MSFYLGESPSTLACTSRWRSRLDTMAKFHDEQQIPW